MLFVKTGNQPGVLLNCVHLLLSVCIFSNEFSRGNLQVDEQRRKANFSMQMERHVSHRAEKIDWCPSPNKGLPIQPRKYFPLSLTDGRPIFNQIISRARFQEIVRGSMKPGALGDHLTNFKQFDLKCGMTHFLIHLFHALI